MTELRLPNLRHGLTEVYLTQILHTAGMALIAIFVPIYLLTLGYSINQALVYVLTQYAGFALLSPFAAWLNDHIGIKKTTVVRIPFVIAQFVTLYSLSTTNVHYLLPAFLGALSGVMYWIPMNTLFLKFSHAEKRGKEVGRAQFLSGAAHGIMPAIGGIIAASFGFPVLILIALGLISIASAPLFLSEEIKTRTRFSWKDMWALRKHNFVGFNVAEGFVSMAAGVFFPLLIFTTLRTPTSVGYIESLGMIIFTIASLVYGSFLDRKNKITWLRISAVLFALTILVRPFLSTAWQFAVIIIFGALTAALYQISYSATSYDVANSLGEKADEFIVVKEIYLNLGRISILGLAIILPWEWGFFIAGFALLISAIIMHPTHGPVA